MNFVDSALVHWVSGSIGRASVFKRLVKRCFDQGLHGSGAFSKTIVSSLYQFSIARR